MSPRVNGSARIERESGDVRVAANPAQALGLSQLAIEAKFVDDAMAATGGLDAASLGTVALAASASSLARDARLAGRVTANVTTLRLLEEMVGTAAIINGRAALDLALGGTLGAPALAGTATADDVRIDVPQYGIALREGRLRAKLEGDALVLEARSIKGVTIDLIKFDPS